MSDSVRKATVWSQNTKQPRLPPRSPGCPVQDKDVRPAQQRPFDPGTTLLKEKREIEALARKTSFAGQHKANNSPKRREREERFEGSSEFADIGGKGRRDGGLLLVAAASQRCFSYLGPSFVCSPLSTRCGKDASNHARSGKAWVPQEDHLGPGFQGTAKGFKQARAKASRRQAGPKKLGREACLSPRIPPGRLSKWSSVWRCLTRVRRGYKHARTSARKGATTLSAPLHGTAGWTGRLDSGSS